MLRTAVAVNRGSIWSDDIEVPFCRVTIARFAPRALLNPHTHDRATLGVMLDGCFVTRYRGRELRCDSQVAWVSPREEKHAHEVSDAGAHVIIVEPAPKQNAEFERLTLLLESFFSKSSGELAVNARRLAAELSVRDNLSCLAIESIALDMLVRAARSCVTRHRSTQEPLWLLQARDIIHEQFRRGIGLTQLAALVQVDASTLATAFKHYYGNTVCGYARDLRIAWAVTEITTSTDPISAIAFRAGYSDQSHLTRDCKLRIGATPAQLRMQNAAER